MGFVENYSGIHSIDFIQNDSRLNTWRDFHLIPTKRPELVDPVPNSQSVMIPGTDKRIDIVSSLPEGITYDIRQGSWEFVIDHDQWSSWDEAYRELAKAINGNAMTIMLDDGSVYGYSGRLRVSGYNPGSNWSTITIMYILDGRRYVVGRLIHKDITQNGNYNARDDGAEGYSDVTVTVPTIDARIGTKSVTSNGSYYARNDNYDGYSRVDVNVPATIPRLQEKSTTVNGDVTADSGYDGLSLVSVNVDTSVSPGDHQEYKPSPESQQTESATICMITITEITGYGLDIHPTIVIEGNISQLNVLTLITIENGPEPEVNN